MRFERKVKGSVHTVNTFIERYGNSSNPGNFFLGARRFEAETPPIRFVNGPLPQGWKLVGLKLVTPGRALVERHYEEHVGKVSGGAGERFRLLPSCVGLAGG